MSANTKNKILLVAVIGLLLINIAMLFFFLNKGPERHGPRGGREARMSEFLKQDIGFSAQQLQQYDTLSKQHREKIRSSFDTMRSSKERLLKDLGAMAFSDSAMRLAAEQSAGMQKEMELKMLQHFADIRRICTAEQQPKFDSLFYKIWSRKGPDKKKTEEK